MHVDIDTCHAERRDPVSWDITRDGAVAKGTSNKQLTLLPMNSIILVIFYLFLCSTAFSVSTTEQHTTRHMRDVLRFPDSHLLCSLCMFKLAMAVIRLDNGTTLYRSRGART
jgi:hypothetical protein